jgi:hypothetical protein
MKNKNSMKNNFIKLTLLVSMQLIFSELGAQITQNNLILDLDADKSVVVQNGDKVIQWSNQSNSGVATHFVKNDGGRTNNPNLGAGSGRPTYLTNLSELNGHNTISFREDELVNFEENAFDHLTKGSGFTWIMLVKPYALPQPHTGFANVNAFFGNLRNSQKVSDGGDASGTYEGFWGCFNNNRSFYSGTRNGIGGRDNANNPQLDSNINLQVNKYYIIASRLQAGTGNRTLEIFINSATANASMTSVIRNQSSVNPSFMAVGTERNAINHPGYESFDGEIARFLIYEAPLSNQQLASTISSLNTIYLDDTPVSSGPTITLEAEQAVLSGNAQIETCGNTSGSDLVSKISKADGSAVTFNNISVDSPNYTLTLQYYNPASARSIKYQVNGGTTQTINIPAGNGWCWQGGSPYTTSESITLSTTQLNSIKVFESAVLDKIILEEIGGGTNPAIVLEAENAQLNGSASASVCANASGGFEVGGINSNDESNSLQFNNIVPTDSNNTLRIYYKNSTASARSIKYRINNGAVQIVSLASGSGWCYEGGSPVFQDIPVSLNASQTNTIKFFKSLVIDKIEVISSSTSNKSVFKKKDALSKKEVQTLVFYPSPVKKGDLLTISLAGISEASSLIGSEVVLSVMNGLGSIVKVATSTLKGSDYTVATDDLESGVYYIQLLVNNEVYTNKIIVE